MFEYSEIDRQAENEGLAMRRALKNKTPRRGVGHSNRSALSKDYRVRRGRHDILKELNVIDGKPT